ncbi:MAG: hypothetical protein ACE5Q6_09635 [Dehalococcoidia bacterium]
MAIYIRIGGLEIVVLAGEEEEIAVGTDGLLLEQDDGSVLLLESGTTDRLLLEG